MLLILLLPAGIGLMALAWIIHGALLERMTMDLVERRLKDEVAFLEHQIRQSGGQIVIDRRLFSGSAPPRLRHRHRFSVWAVHPPETWTRF